MSPAEPPCRSTSLTPYSHCCCLQPDMPGAQRPLYLFFFHTKDSLTLDTNCLSLLNSIFTFLQIHNGSEKAFQETQREFNRLMPKMLPQELWKASLHVVKAGDPMSSSKLHPSYHSYSLKFHHFLEFAPGCFQFIFKAHIN